MSRYDEICTAVAELVGDDERQVARIGVRPYAYRTSHWMAEINVVYGDESFERLVLKDLGPHTLAESARKTKPAFVLDPLREIEVYRDVLAGAGFETAGFRGAVVEPTTQRYWLMMELVEGAALYEFASLDRWCAAAESIAELHLALADAEPEHAIRWDGDYVALWIERASRACPDPAVLGLAARAGELIERLLCLPIGFIHGELYASNIIVDETRERVCPIDWEMAGIGPQLLDLAALTAGAWSGEQRREISYAYWQRAENAVSLDDFLADLDLCRLYVALQWLGWSPGWQPPPAHAHDWLADVLELSRTIGVA
jgi:hypothetical protein